jgi:hypothetical protein
MGAMPECYGRPPLGRYVGTAIAAALLLAAGVARASSSTASGTEARSARASIDFAIRIPQVLSLRTLDGRGTIEVPADVPGGPAVVVPDAASFEIRSNLPGYGLRFEITDPDVVAVDVAGLDRELRVTPGGAIVRFPPIAAPDRKLRRTLAYRLVFREGVTPGRRPMPVAYSLLGE